MTKTIDQWLQNGSKTKMEAALFSLKETSKVRLSTIKSGNVLMIIDYF